MPGKTYNITYVIIVCLHLLINLSAQPLLVLTRGLCNRQSTAVVVLPIISCSVGCKISDKPRGGTAVFQLHVERRATPPAGNPAEWNFRMVYAYTYTWYSAHIDDGLLCTSVTIRVIMYYFMSTAKVLLYFQYQKKKI